jgi:hypothetical protein
MSQIAKLLSSLSHNYNRLLPSEEQPRLRLNKIATKYSDVTKQASAARAEQHRQSLLVSESDSSKRGWLAVIYLAR